jgi:hypothetical protein
VLPVRLLLVVAVALSVLAALTGWLSSARLCEQLTGTRVVCLSC